MGTPSPRYPVGYIPGAEFVDQGTPTGFRLGIIQRVDEISMKADVKVITGGGFRAEIDLTQSLCGPRSFWGGVPEEGSVVILAYRTVHRKIGDAMIIGFIPTGNRLGLRFDPFAPADPDSISAEDAAEFEAQFGSPTRIKRLRLSPGDVGGMSSSGSELVLSKSLRMCNRAGDLMELRDEERTLVTQAVHRFDNDSGVRRYSGPVRRQALYVPSDTYKINPDGTKTLRTEAEGYFGRDELQAGGPGAQKGSDMSFADMNGKLLDLFNNETLYPSVTYSNGKTVFYASTAANKSPEAKIDDGGGNTFTEVRTEIAHDTDLVQEVQVEVDGFTLNPRKVFIEHVMGTVCGNDPYSTGGLKVYGKAVRPQLWTSATAMNQGKMTFEEVVRGQNGDLDVNTAAGAYLLNILGPVSKDDNVPFSVAVQKQGKLLVQIPKPSNEFYNDNVKGISEDLNVLGAIKLYVGASTPTATSMYAKFEGGIKAEIGRNSDTGNSIDVTYLGPVNAQFVGAADENGNGAVTQIAGGFALSSTGDHKHDVGGSVFVTANGAMTHQADKIIHTAPSGYTLSSGGFQQTNMGLTTLTYAMLKTENIAAGGEVKTIAAGSALETIAAGAKTVTVGAGPISMTSGAAMTQTSGAAMSQTAGGALTTSAGGAISQTAGAAFTMTAGAVMTQTAPAGIILNSVNIQFGGPAAVLGVVRATPAMPPGAPTLDYITGLPLLGSAMVRSV